MPDTKPTEAKHDSHTTQLDAAMKSLRLRVHNAFLAAPTGDLRELLYDVYAALYPLVYKSPASDAADGEVGNG